MDRPSLIATAIGLAIIAVGLACGDDEAKPPRGVDEDDLTKLVLQLGDLPEGSKQGEGCGDATAATPVPTPSDSIFKFFELPASGTTPSACLMSVAIVLDSSDEAARSLDSIDENFKIVHQPLVDRSNCSVEQLRISGLGDDRRGYATTCESCLQLYQIAFRRGTVLSEVWLYTQECEFSSNEAASYARKQEQRVEAALRDTP